MAKARSTRKQGSSRIYPSAREKLLDAAERVLDRGGPVALTVDAVVAQARMSKGGFFYHFKTKRDLILAVGERLFNEAARRQLAIVERDKDAHGRLTRAYVRLTTESDAAFDRRMRAYALAMIALVQDDPTLVPMVQQANREFFRAFEQDGLPSAQRLVIILAGQGLWLTQALKYHELTRRQISEIGKLLVSMTRKQR